MYISGLRGTFFESIFPWKLGAVLEISDLKTWFNKYQSIMNGIEYNQTPVTTLGESTYVLTLNPTIAGGTTANLIIKGTRTGGYLDINLTVPLTTTVSKTLSIIKGYTYSFSLSGTGISWTSGSAPSSFVCSSDKTQAIGITIAS